MEGTRQVFTYTEIMTDDVIEEYVNDSLIDQRPNPLGTIPVVHIPNVRISGSPWGLSDIQDILPLQREYNEKLLEVSDIINYNVEPVTVVTGAKLATLERGTGKVWAFPSEKARVDNLGGGESAIGPSLEYLDHIKQSMFEMIGVPLTALGQEQAISNTSGVALSIQYLPMMQRLHMKHMTYGEGFKKINHLVLLHLFRFEPNTALFDPDTEGVLEEGMPTQVDVNDPLAYQTDVHWPEPLPTDQLVILNEIQSKLALGIESKRGALRSLGEEFPDEKMLEIYYERLQDLIDQGALDMKKALIESVIVNTTGIIPGGDGEGSEIVPPPQQPQNSNPSSNGPLPGIQPPVMQNPLNPEQLSVQQELVQLAAGTKLAQRRNPDNDS